MSYTKITINGNNYDVKNLNGFFGNKGDGEGKGGFGTVYFGKKSGDTEDTLAFKFLIQNKNEDIVQNFKMETELFKELAEKISKGCKKYIIDLKDSGIAPVNGKNEYIVVMEKPKDFITIQQYIDNKTDKNVDNVTKIYTEMLKGIYCINSSGFVHCDIKPANIMVHPTRYEIKYIDFGGLVRDGSYCIIGTDGYFNYNSPDEQYYNGARDLYAIGKTISNIFNDNTDQTNSFNNNLKDPFPKLSTLLLIKNLKKKVIDLQKFYRSVCEDEYIEIGELKKDETRNDIYFINKNGYKTFVEGPFVEDVTEFKRTIERDYKELFYDGP